MGMKTPKEIRLELDHRQMVDEVKRVADLIEFIEKQVSYAIASKASHVHFSEDERHIGFYLNKIKPTLERAGYAIERRERRQTVRRLMKPDYEITEHYIHIGWE